MKLITAMQLDAGSLHDLDYALNQFSRADCPGVHRCHVCYVCPMSGDDGYRAYIDQCQVIYRVEFITVSGKAFSCMVTVSSTHWSRNNVQSKFR